MKSKQVTPETFRLSRRLVAALLLAGSLAPGRAEPVDAGLRESSASPTVPATGAALPGLGSFDRLMLSFVESQKIPGAALAVVRGSRLVLARGYGWADVERRVPAGPLSLFRIASLSKPITAVAVLQLVEAGRLRLSDRVLDVLDLRSTREALDGTDPRWDSITVRHLLEHTAGFDRTDSFDPMFRSVEIARSLGVKPPAQPEQIIRYMLARPLDFEPGARYAYSNFGYCLLGRVIERVSDMPYETRVRESVLEPLGISRMRIGETLRSDTASGEVTYYGSENPLPAVIGEIGREVPRPYGGWCLEAMDAHGGWVASVVDLARFAASLASAAESPLEKESTLRRLFARPEGPAGQDPEGRPAAVYYALGWMVRPTGDGGRNAWHTGSLDGTAALMVRRHDGLVWVVLTNTRSGPDYPHLGRGIDPLLHGAAAEVTEWPEGDLFDEYLEPGRDASDSRRNPPGPRASSSG